MAWAHGGEGGAGHFFTDALPWVVAVLAVVAVIRWITKLRAGRKDEALRSLEARLAKGEVNKAQFDRMKADLGG